MDVEQVRWTLEHCTLPSRGNAVLAPLVEGDDGLSLLFEVRAHALAHQPGEVCFPGGHIEADESPLDAAIRETCEELLVRPSQIDVLGSLGTFAGPGGRPLYAYVAHLCSYQGSYAQAEVERIFTLPFAWLMEHEAHVYHVAMQPSFPEDFPWQLIPMGTRYPWKTQLSDVPFYEGTDPVLWGATARVVKRLCDLLDNTSSPSE